MSRMRFDRFEVLADTLEEVLRRHSLEIGCGSHLEHLALRAAELNQLWQERCMPKSFIEELDIMRDVASFWQLAELVLAHQDNAEFLSLLPHLKLLASAEYSSQTAPVSHDATTAGLQASDKLFELLFGSACLCHGTRLEMDHPFRSSNGKNPDVLVTLPHNGRPTRWGFACKAPRSRRPETLVNNIEVGVRQIEAADCEIGMVAINPRSILSNDVLSEVSNESGVERLTSTPPDFKAQSILLIEDVKVHFGRAFVAEEPADGQAREDARHVRQQLHRLFDNSKALPALLIMAQTVLPTLCGSHIVWGLIRAMGLVPIEFDSAGEISHSDVSRLGPQIMSAMSLINAGFHLVSEGQSE